MFLALLAYLGGVLTILSPCILPVLPFIFTRAGEPFRKSGLPLLIGMAVTFAIVSSFAVVSAGWVIHANQWGRWIALVLLTVFGFSLIFPSLSEKLTHPLTQLGGKLTAHQDHEGKGSVTRSFLLGVATGFLWAPCAGPILGLVLTGAAIQGASIKTSALLLAYALGAATSLALALFAGNRVLKAMKKFLSADRWVKKILGSAVLFGVLAIALGWDQSFLTRISRAPTESIEEGLLQKLNVHPSNESHENGATLAAALASEGTLPDLSGAVEWINSEPLSAEKLKGKVVLIDFWTYSCINCLRTLPYVRAWAEKYKDRGLVVIGVHTPEFAFEKDESNVKKAVRELGITYPVAVDSNYAIWKSFNNEYWPAHYFVDAKGVIRHHHFGEGDYDESEKIIQELLAERNGAGNTQAPNLTKASSSQSEGVQAQSDASAYQSPETYIGYARAENLRVSPEVVPEQATNYTPASELLLNQWTLTGLWKVSAESASLIKASGKIIFRFHARDLHLVLGPGAAGRPIRFRVRIDGKNPAEDHGVDVDAAGNGVVKESRLYQLIRQRNKTSIRDRTFEIEFLDPDVQAFAFTFG